MHIRRATPDQAPALSEIAHQAKRHWGYPEHWINHWTEDLTIEADFVANNEVFLAEKDDQIVDEDETAYFDNSAIESAKNLFNMIP